jgi:hypothetical protein
MKLTRGLKAFLLWIELLLFNVAIARLFPEYALAVFIWLCFTSIGALYFLLVEDSLIEKN